MKKALILLLFLLLNTYPQNFFYNCGMNNVSPLHLPASQVKPLKTMPVSDTSAYIRILLVFAEFQGDESWDPGSQYWQPNSPPIYIDSIFSPVKKLSGYGKYIISDYFDVVTRNQSDMIGDAYHIILPHSYNYYKTVFGDNSAGRDQANLDVLKMLDTNLVVDWNRYDIWSWNGYDFVRQSDNLIDFIYIQYRRGKPDFFSLSSGGHADIMVNYNTLQQNKSIRQGTTYLSSGMYGINGSSESREIVLDYFVHEYCHFLFGVLHRPYSRISGNEGTETAMGWERAFSPQDAILLDLADVDTVSYERMLYSLPDFVTTGKVLKINSPFTANDYFLVCNRRRLVNYDCNTGGDTVAGRFFYSAGGLDKGIYIYHVINGNSYDGWSDMECADGLWNWRVSGFSTPDWSNVQQLPVFEKISVGRFNDDPTTLYMDSARQFSRDGMSVFSIEPGMIYNNKWFSTGKRHQFLGDPGMDRMFTNYRENWCSRECLGDRYDCWKGGYNELFSPFSSPNTMSRSIRSQNDTTGIFIYIERENNDTAYFRIYRSGAGGYTMSDILRLTPPSRPMLYKLFWQNTANGTHPKLIWDNSREPDMIRTGNYKRYNVFKAVSYSFEIVPSNFEWISTYDDFTPGDTAGFIDYSVTTGGSFYNGKLSNIYCRYYITCTDNTELNSVPSDFLSIISYAGENNASRENEEFFVWENYPNPFNPFTKFRFRVPEFGKVNLTIYDVLGREVAVIVNELLQSGTFEVTWDASNYSSGVYFFKLTAGKYSDVKKMVLMK